MGKMKKQMKDAIAHLKKGQFRVVYESLNRARYEYKIEPFSHDFRGVDSFLKYTYLLYVISREMRADLHLLACEFLVYTDTICDDVYPLVRWHVLQALIIDPWNVPVLEWAVSYFSNCSSSPFSEAELLEFQHRIKHSLEPVPPASL